MSSTLITKSPEAFFRFWLNVTPQIGSQMWTTSPYGINSGPVLWGQSQMDFLLPLPEVLPYLTDGQMEVYLGVGVRNTSLSLTLLLSSVMPPSTGLNQ